MTNPTTDTGADALIDLTSQSGVSLIGGPPLAVPSAFAQDPDGTGELLIDDEMRERIRTSHHPSARGSEDRCDPSRSRFAPFSECPHCGGAMAAEHAHFRCAGCGWRDSCCD